MHVVTCPACTAPVPLPPPATVRTLATLDCAYCGAKHPLDAAAHAELVAVGERVWLNEREERGLSKRQRKSVVEAGKLEKRLYVLLAVLLVPWLCFALSGLQAFIGDSNVPLGPDELLLYPLLLALPPILSIVVVVRTVRRTRERRGVLLALCGARPPEHAGEPSRCRFCSAPLLANAVEGIARCGHCGADNVVAAEQVARASLKHRKGLQAIGKELKVASVDLEALIRRMRWRVYLAFIGVPIGSVAIFIIVFVAAVSFESPADPAREYAVVRTKDGACLGWIRTPAEGGAPHLDFDVRSPGGLESPTPLEQVHVTERLRIDGLIGRRLRFGEGGDEVGEVFATFSTPATTNWVKLRKADGSEDSAAPQGLCFVE